MAKDKGSPKVGIRPIVDPQALGDGELSEIRARQQETNPEMYVSPSKIKKQSGGVNVRKPVVPTADNAPWTAEEARGEHITSHLAAGDPYAKAADAPVNPETPDYKKINKLIDDDPALQSIVGAKYGGNRVKFIEEMRKRRQKLYESHRFYEDPDLDYQQRGLSDSSTDWNKAKYNSAYAKEYPKDPLLDYIDNDAFGQPIRTKRQAEISRYKAQKAAWEKEAIAQGIKKEPEYKKTEPTPAAPKEEFAWYDPRRYMSDRMSKPFGNSEDAKGTPVVKVKPNAFWENQAVKDEHFHRKDYTSPQAPDKMPEYWQNYYALKDLSLASSIPEPGKEGHIYTKATPEAGRAIEGHFVAALTQAVYKTGIKNPAAVAQYLMYDSQYEVYDAGLLEDLVYEAKTNPMIGMYLENVPGLGMKKQKVSFSSDVKEQARAIKENHYVKNIVDLYQSRRRDYISIRQMNKMKAQDARRTGKPLKPPVDEDADPIYNQVWTPEELKNYSGVLEATGEMGEVAVPGVMGWLSRNASNVIATLNFDADDGKLIGNPLGMFIEGNPTRAEFKTALANSLTPEEIVHLQKLSKDKGEDFYLDPSFQEKFLPVVAETMASMTVPGGSLKTAGAITRGVRTGITTTAKLAKASKTVQKVKQAVGAEKLTQMVMGTAHGRRFAGAIKTAFPHLTDVAETASTFAVNMLLEEGADLTAEEAGNAFKTGTAFAISGAILGKMAGNMAQRAVQARGSFRKARAMADKMDDASKAKVMETLDETLSRAYSAGYLISQPFVNIAQTRISAAIESGNDLEIFNELGTRTSDYSDGLIGLFFGRRMLNQSGHALKSARHIDDFVRHQEKFEESREKSRKVYEENTAPNENKSQPAGEPTQKPADEAGPGTAPPTEPVDLNSSTFEEEISLVDYAAREGISYQTAYRRAKKGKVPGFVPRGEGNSSHRVRVKKTIKKEPLEQVPVDPQPTEGEQEPDHNGKQWEQRFTGKKSVTWNEYMEGQDADFTPTQQAVREILSQTVGDTPVTIISQEEAVGLFPDGPPPAMFYHDGGIYAVDGVRAFDGRYADSMMEEGLHALTAPWLKANPDKAEALNDIFKEALSDPGVLASFRGDHAAAQEAGVETSRTEYYSGDPNELAAAFVNGTLSDFDKHLAAADEPGFFEKIKERLASVMGRERLGIHEKYLEWVKEAQKWHKAKEGQPDGVVEGAEDNEEELTNKIPTQQQGPKTVVEPTADDIAESFTVDQPPVTEEGWQNFRGAAEDLDKKGSYRANLRQAGVEGDMTAVDPDTFFETMQLSELALRMGVPDVELYKNIDQYQRANNPAWEFLAPASRLRLARAFGEELFKTNASNIADGVLKEFVQKREAALSAEDAQDDFSKPDDLFSKNLETATGFNTSRKARRWMDRVYKQHGATGLIERMTNRVEERLAERAGNPDINADEVREAMISMLSEYIRKNGNNQSFPTRKIKIADNGVVITKGEDVSMPQMTGWENAKILAKRSFAESPMSSGPVLKAIEAAIDAPVVRVAEESGKRYKQGTLSKDTASELTSGWNNELMTAFFENDLFFVPKGTTGTTFLDMSGWKSELAGSKRSWGRPDDVYQMLKSQETAIMWRMLDNSNVWDYGKKPNLKPYTAIRLFDLFNEYRGKAADGGIMSVTPEMIFNNLKEGTDTAYFLENTDLAVKDLSAIMVKLHDGHRIGDVNLSPNHEMFKRNVAKAEGMPDRVRSLIAYHSLGTFNNVYNSVINPGGSGRFKTTKSSSKYASTIFGNQYHTYGLDPETKRWNADIVLDKFRNDGYDVPELTLPDENADAHREAAAAKGIYYDEDGTPYHKFLVLDDETVDRLPPEIKDYLTREKMKASEYNDGGSIYINEDARALHSMMSGKRPEETGSIKASYADSHQGNFQLLKTAFHASAMADDYVRAIPQYAPVVQFLDQMRDRGYAGITFSSSIKGDGTWRDIAHQEGDEIWDYDSQRRLKGRRVIKDGKMDYEKATPELLDKRAQKVLEGDYSPSIMKIPLVGQGGLRFISTSNEVDRTHGPAMGPIANMPTTVRGGMAEAVGDAIRVAQRNLTDKYINEYVTLGKYRQGATKFSPDELAQLGEIAQRVRKRMISGDLSIEKLVDKTQYQEVMTALDLAVDQEGKADLTYMRAIDSLYPGIFVGMEGQPSMADYDVQRSGTRAQRANATGTMLTLAPNYFPLAHAARGRDYLRMQMLEDPRYIDEEGRPTAIFEQVYAEKVARLEALEKEMINEKGQLTAESRLVYVTSDVLEAATKKIREWNKQNPDKYIEPPMIGERCIVQLMPSDAVESAAPFILAGVCDGVNRIELNHEFVSGVNGRDFDNDGYGISFRDPSYFKNLSDFTQTATPKSGNYEVSTAGDKRYSALNARLSSGKTIEEAYQTDVKGYGSVKEGKGKPPKNTALDTKAEYQKLWDQWAAENPDAIEELRTASEGKQLTDKFAKPGTASQADALTAILDRTKPAVAGEPVKQNSNAFDDLWEALENIGAWKNVSKSGYDDFVEYAKKDMDDGISPFVLADGTRLPLVPRNTRPHSTPYYTNELKMAGANIGQAMSGLRQLMESVQNYTAIKYPGMPPGKQEYRISAGSTQIRYTSENWSNNLSFWKQGLVDPFNVTNVNLDELYYGTIIETYKGKKYSSLTPEDKKKAQLDIQTFLKEWGTSFNTAKQMRAGTIPDSPLFMMDAERDKQLSQSMYALSKLHRRAHELPAVEPESQQPSKMFAPVDRPVKLPNKTKHAEKDQAKANYATKFIGAGSEQSSTAAYAAAYAKAGLANTGQYVAGDVVFISAEGARKGRVQPPFAEIDKAIAARASFVTDVPMTRATKYNVGERQVAQHLIKNGYVELEPGKWAPQVSTAAKKSLLDLQRDAHARHIMAKQVVASQMIYNHILKTTGHDPKKVAPEVKALYEAIRELSNSPHTFLRVLENMKDPAAKQAAFEVIVEEGEVVADHIPLHPQVSIEKRDDQSHIVINDAEGNVVGAFPFDSIYDNKGGLAPEVAEVMSEQGLGADIISPESLAGQVVEKRLFGDQFQKFIAEEAPANSVVLVWSGDQKTKKTFVSNVAMNGARSRGVKVAQILSSGHLSGGNVKQTLDATLDIIRRDPSQRIYFANAPLKTDADRGEYENLKDELLKAGTRIRLDRFDRERFAGKAMGKLASTETQAGKLLGDYVATASQDEPVLANKLTKVIAGISNSGMRPRTEDGALLTGQVIGVMATAERSGELAPMAVAEAFQKIMNDANDVEINWADDNIALGSYHTGVKAKAAQGEIMKEILGDAGVEREEFVKMLQEVFDQTLITEVTPELYERKFNDISAAISKRLGDFVDETDIKNMIRAVSPTAFERIYNETAGMNALARKAQTVSFFLQVGAAAEQLSHKALSQGKDLKSMQSFIIRQLKTNINPLARQDVLNYMRVVSAHTTVVDPEAMTDVAVAVKDGKIVGTSPVFAGESYDQELRISEKVAFDALPNVEYLKPHSNVVNMRDALKSATGKLTNAFNHAYGEDLPSPNVLKEIKRDVLKTKAAEPTTVIAPDFEGLLSDKLHIDPLGKATPFSMRDLIANMVSVSSSYDGVGYASATLKVGSVDVPYTANMNVTDMQKLDEAAMAVVAAMPEPPNPNQIMALKALLHNMASNHIVSNYFTAMAEKHRMWSREREQTWKGTPDELNKFREWAEGNVSAISTLADKLRSADLDTQVATIADIPDAILSQKAEELHTLMQDAMATKDGITIRNVTEEMRQATGRLEMTPSETMRLLKEYSGAYAGKYTNNVVEYLDGAFDVPDSMKDLPFVDKEKVGFMRRFAPEYLKFSNPRRTALMAHLGDKAIQSINGAMRMAYDAEYAPGRETDLARWGVHSELNLDGYVRDNKLDLAKIQQLTKTNTVVTAEMAGAKTMDPVVVATRLHNGDVGQIRGRLLGFINRPTEISLNKESEKLQKSGELDVDAFMDGTAHRVFAVVADPDNTNLYVVETTNAYHITTGSKVGKMEKMIDNSIRGNAMEKVDIPALLDNISRVSVKRYLHSKQQPDKKTAVEVRDGANVKMTDQLSQTIDALSLETAQQKTLEYAISTSTKTSGWLYGGKNHMVNAVAGVAMTAGAVAVSPFNLLLGSGLAYKGLSLTARSLLQIVAGNKVKQVANAVGGRVRPFMMDDRLKGIGKEDAETVDATTTAAFMARLGGEKALYQDALGAEESTSRETTWELNRTKDAMEKATRILQRIDKTPPDLQQYLEEKVNWYKELGLRAIPLGEGRVIIDKRGQTLDQLDQLNLDAIDMLFTSTKYGALLGVPFGVAKALNKLTTSNFAKTVQSEEQSIGQSSAKWAKTFEMNLKASGYTPTSPEAQLEMRKRKQLYIHNANDQAMGKFDQRNPHLKSTTARLWNLFSQFSRNFTIDSTYGMAKRQKYYREVSKLLAQDPDFVAWADKNHIPIGYDNIANQMGVLRRQVAMGTGTAILKSGIMLALAATLSEEFDEDAGPISKFAMELYSDLQGRDGGVINQADVTNSVARSLSADNPYGTVIEGALTFFLDMFSEKKMSPSMDTKVKEHHVGFAGNLASASGQGVGGKAMWDLAGLATVGAYTLYANDTSYDEAMAKKAGSVAKSASMVVPIANVAGMAYGAAEQITNDPENDKNKKKKKKRTGGIN